MGYRSTTDETCGKCGRFLSSSSSRLHGYCGMCSREGFGRDEPIPKQRSTPRPKPHNPNILKRGCRRTGEPCPNCGQIHETRVELYWKKHLQMFKGGEIC